MTSPLDTQVAAELERLAGGLDLLYRLRAELTLRCDEANSKASLETLDEVLTLLASLETEYQRRYEAAHPKQGEHASYIFLVGSDSVVHPLPHALYVALAKDEAVAPAFAGQLMRVTDWYVRLEGGNPVALVNETHTLLQFDVQGRVDRAATPSFHPHRDSATLASESASLPKPQERARMLELIFDARPAE